MNIKKHGKDHQGIKGGTLGGHNPLCLKSYKIRYTNKNLKNQNLLAVQGLHSLLSDISVRLNDSTTFFPAISLCKIEQW